MSEPSYDAWADANPRMAIRGAVVRALNEELDRLDVVVARRRVPLPEGARSATVFWDDLAATPAVGQEAPAPSARSGWRSHRDLTE